MNIKTEYKIGESVSFYTYESVYSKCECCDNSIEKRVKVKKIGIIEDIRIEKDSISYGVNSGGFTLLLNETKLTKAKK